MYVIMYRKSVNVNMHGLYFGNGESKLLKDGKATRQCSLYTMIHSRLSLSLILYSSQYTHCVWGEPTLPQPPPTLFMTTFPALSSLGHHASSWKLPFLKPFCNRKRNSKTEPFVNTRLFCFPYRRYFYVSYSLKVKEVRGNGNYFNRIIGE